VLESTACRIGPAPRVAELVEEGGTGPLALLLAAIDGVRGTQGWLHLEVVGSPAAAGYEAAAAVASHLRDQGASHIVRGDVWDDRGCMGWRVTALLPAKNVTACQRALFRLGAGRVVGLRPQIVFDRDAPSTFDNLCSNLW